MIILPRTDKSTSRHLDGQRVERDIEEGLAAHAGHPIRPPMTMNAIRRLAATGFRANHSLVRCMTGCRRRHAIRRRIMFRNEPSCPNSS